MPLAERELQVPPGPDTGSEGSEQTADSLAPSTTGSPRELKSIASFLHVLSSQRASTDLDTETFNALVDLQLSSKEPIRAPWFRTTDQQRVRGPVHWRMSGVPCSWHRGLADGLPRRRPVPPGLLRSPHRCPLGSPPGSRCAWPA